MAPRGAINALYADNQALWPDSLLKQAHRAREPAKRRMSPVLRRKRRKTVPLSGFPLFPCPLSLFWDGLRPSRALIGINQHKVHKVGPEA